MARIGENIGGKYEILREVEKGRASVLYLAKDGRQVLRYLREFRRGVAADVAITAANAAKGTAHPGVMGIIEVINGTDAVYVVSEYVQGQSLKDIFKTCGSQPVDVVVKWAGQIADALDALHTGNVPVTYEGLCPDTVYIGTDGNAILADVASARDHGANDGYAAPGNVSGNVGGDVYSLGMLVRRMLTGVEPASASGSVLPLRSYDPEIPGSLEWLVQKATQLDVSERFENCAEMACVLSRLNKYDYKNKKKCRARVRTVLILLILTIFFGVAAGALILGSVLLKGDEVSTPAKDDTPAQVVEDIDIDEDADECLKNVFELYKTVETVTARGSDDADDKTISLAQLEAKFSKADMTALKKSDPASYVRLQYYLGILVWERYEVDAEHNKTKDWPDVSETMTVAMPYFREAVRVLESDDELEISGSVKTTVRSLYKLSFLWLNRDAIAECGLKDSSIYTDVEKYAGITEDDCKVIDGKGGVYGCIWDTCVETFEILSDDGAILDNTVIKTFGIIADITVECGAEFEDHLGRDFRTDIATLSKDMYSDVNGGSYKYYRPLIKNYADYKIGIAKNAQEISFGDTAETTSKKKPVKTDKVTVESTEATEEQATAESSSAESEAVTTWEPATEELYTTEEPAATETENVIKPIEPDDPEFLPVNPEPDETDTDAPSENIIGEGGAL